MGPAEVAAILFGVFALLIILRVPVAFALGLACVPVFFIAGISTPPTPAASAVDDPEMPAKSIDTSTLTWPRPPGR